MNMKFSHLQFTLDKSNFQEVVASREVDQKRKEEAMERLAEARQFVEVETEKRRKKREAQEKAELQFREGNQIWM